MCLTFFQNVVPDQISSLVEVEADSSMFLKPFHEAPATVDLKAMLVVNLIKTNNVKKECYLIRHI